MLRTFLIVAGLLLAVTSAQAAVPSPSPSAQQILATAMRKGATVDAALTACRDEYPRKTCEAAVTDAQTQVLQLWFGDVPAPMLPAWEILCTKNLPALGAKQCASGRQWRAFALANTMLTEGQPVAECATMPGLGPQICAAAEHRMTEAKAAAAAKRDKRFRLLGFFAITGGLLLFISWLLSSAGRRRY